MIYQKAHVENGEIVIEEIKEIDQEKLTSDCWLIQFSGLSECDECDLRGTKNCGGGQMLKKMRAN